MSQYNKVLQKMKDSPNNIDFEEACWLAVKVGFQRRKGGSGSHRIFKHKWVRDIQGSMLDLQERNGKAKPYQIRQLLEKIEDFNLFEEGKNG